MRAFVHLLPGLLALALALSAPAARAAGPGDPAPNFAGESNAGKIGLSDFAGKTLVLAFYPKDFTGG